MVKYSVYPQNLDSSTTIPIQTDKISPVKSEIVNRLQDAVISTQTELGTKPSGTHTTVKDRLDFIEQNQSNSGSGKFTVEYNNAIVNSQVNNIDFVGDVQVSTAAPNQVLITIGGLNFQTQEQPTVSNNQVSFTLSHTPLQFNAVQMFINGFKREYGSDYLVSNKTVTYVGSPSLVSSDKVEFWYIVNNSILTTNNSVDVKQNGSAVLTNITSINFTGSSVAVTNAGSGQVNVAISALTSISGISAGGDLSGTYPNPIVAKINGTTVNTTSGGDVGKALVVSSAGVSAWTTVSASGTAGGDLSGSFPNPTVAKINGTTIPTTAGGDTGKVLTVTGAGSATWQTASGGGSAVTITRVMNGSIWTGDNTGGDVWLGRKGISGTSLWFAKTANRCLLYQELRIPHGATLHRLDVYIGGNAGSPALPPYVQLYKWPVNNNTVVAVGSATTDGASPAIAIHALTVGGASGGGSDLGLVIDNSAFLYLFELGSEAGSGASNADGFYHATVNYTTSATADPGGN